MRSTGWLLLLLSLALPVSSQPGGEATPIVVIKGGTLIDVRTGHQVTDSLIVVEGNRIKQAGRASDIVVPRKPG